MLAVRKEMLCSTDVNLRRQYLALCEFNNGKQLCASQKDDLNLLYRNHNADTWHSPILNKGVAKKGEDISRSNA